MEYLEVWHMILHWSVMVFNVFLYWQQGWREESFSILDPKRGLKQIQNNPNIAILSPYPIQIFRFFQLNDIKRSSCCVMRMEMWMVGFKNFTGSHDVLVWSLNGNQLLFLAFTWTFWLVLCFYQVWWTKAKFT